MKVKVGVYLPLGIDGVELCQPIRSGEFRRIFAEVNGVPRSSTWQPVSMQLLHEDDGASLVASDSPWLGSHALIFRATVLRQLGALLTEYGELLPLECSEADLWIYNPTRMVDALDEQRSSVTRFPDGRLMIVNRYVFRATEVASIDIFKIPSPNVSPTFVSHRFVELWRSSGLKGLEFKQLWAPD